MARTLLLRRPSPFAFPGGNPGIDPSHPAAKNLLISTVALNGSHVDLRNGVTGVITGSPTKLIDGVLGPAVAFSGTTDKLNFANFPTTSFTVGTAAVILRINAQGQISDICGDANGTTAGFGLGHDSLTWHIRCGGLFLDVTSLPAPITGETYFYAVSVFGGNSPLPIFVLVRLSTGQVWYLTGHAGFSTPATITGTGNYVVGNRDTTVNRQALANIAATMRSNVYLPLPQMLAWAQDPWSFWYPQKFDLLMALGPSSGSSSVALSGATRMTASMRAAFAGSTALAGRSALTLRGRAGISGSASLAARTALQLKARGAPSGAAALAARLALELTARAQASGRTALGAATRFMLQARLVPPGAIALAAAMFVRLAARAAPTAAASLQARTQGRLNARAAPAGAAALQGRTQVRLSARAAAQAVAGLAGRVRLMGAARGSISATAALVALSGRLATRLSLRGVISFLGGVFIRSPRQAIAAAEDRLVMVEPEIRKVTVDAEIRSVTLSSENRTTTPGA